jgi:phosphopentomutase/2,3-bisphosphoglycerate-independent phosphoglycerate mutase family metalloenzyme
VNRRTLPAIFAFSAMLLASSLFAQSQPKTRNVVLIVADGLRWQEVFTGADPSLLNSENGGIWGNPERLKREFWRDDSNDRRKTLFPFLWSVTAAQGQIIGNQTKGSIARVTNGKAFSYPGYNEMLTGSPDSKIDSNEFGPNPNATVFEWLDKQPEFHDKVAVFATWNTFKDIFNTGRSHLPVQVGWDLPYRGSLSPKQQLINDLYLHTTKLDEEDVYDSLQQVPLLDYVRANHPKVLFVGYGEADNWAHSGRYDLVLHSAHDIDHFVEQLWNTMQSIPAYRDQTTFIITADHGRGSGLTEWKDHGTEQKGSESIWIAVIGPDTQPLGERSNISPVTQSQIAATLACFLGKDYRHDVPAAAAAAITKVLSKALPCNSGR